MRLFVYNVDTDSCREVVVTPNDQWGGSGLCVCMACAPPLPSRPLHGAQPRARVGAGSRSSLGR